jgi:Trypsin-like peptidase domain
MPIGTEILTERMSRAGYSVCRVEIDDDPAGTGFLIGPDTVITNYHVVEKVLSGSKFTKPLTCRFDHAKLPSGGVRQGRVVAVLPDCLDFSRYAAADDDPEHSAPPTDDELDYALLSLSESVGNQPSPMTPTRGWVSIPEATQSLKPGQSLIIIQHPLTAPKLTTRPVRLLSNDGARIIYDAETRPGSSGSPCFSEEYELVALHHRGDPNYSLSPVKQGIPISKIRARLLTKALAEKIPQCLGVEIAKNVLDAIVLNKNEQPTAQFIARWKTDIEETRDGILRLKVQKQLHDFLHRCQKMLPLLIVTLRSTDRANATTTLELHGGNLAEDVSKISEIADKLPSKIRLRPVNNARWIKVMADAATKLRDQSAAWPEDYREAILLMRSEIKRQLVHVNERLVDEVNNLPLHKLAAAFADLAAGNLFDDAKVAGAAGAEAITRVASDLSRFIAEHDSWQEIDGLLWTCEDYLVSDDPMNRRLFDATWGDTLTSLQALLAQSKDPAETQDLTESGALVQTLSEQEDWQNLPEQFGRFRRLTVNSFADLDTALLAKCDEITALHGPLSRITE